MKVDCIFCKIAAGSVPSEVVYEDEQVFAFRDAAPQAPVHILVIPKRHISGLDALAPEDGELVSAVALSAKKIAASEGLVNGWRLVANCGPDAGQAVAHLHFHILGGRKLGWPPG